MKAYVAVDSALAAEYKQKLADDPVFAKDSAARLAFFARRYSSWDKCFGFYPAMRTAVAPG